MVNKENLIPIKKGQRTKEEQEEFAKKGGIASGKARREKRKLKDIALMLLEMQANKKFKDSAKKIFPELEDEEITNAVVMTARQIEKAVAKNDTRAFEAIQATSGQKPSDKVEHKSDGSFKNDKIIFVSELEEKKADKIIDEVIGNGESE